MKAFSFTSITRDLIISLSSFSSQTRCRGGLKVAISRMTNKRVVFLIPLYITPSSATAIITHG